MIFTALTITMVVVKVAMLEDEEVEVQEVGLAADKEVEKRW